jgi:hypothetical protein
MLEAKRILEGTGLRTVAAQTAIVHLGPRSGVCGERVFRLLRGGHRCGSTSILETNGIFLRHDPDHVGHWQPVGHSRAGVLLGKARRGSMRGRGRRVN